jgi:hypothetical protein
MWQSSGILQPPQQIKIVAMKKLGVDLTLGLFPTIRCRLFLSSRLPSENMQEYNFVCCFVWV